MQSSDNFSEEAVHIWSNHCHMYTYMHAMFPILLLKSKLLLTSALPHFTQAKIQQYFMGCYKIANQRQRKMWKVRSPTKFKKTEYSPQWLDEHLDLTKLSMLIIVHVIYEHVKWEAAQAELALVDLASSACSWNDQAPGLLSLKSLTSMGSVTRTIGSFQPYVLSSPGERTASSSIFWSEDPTR